MLSWGDTARVDAEALEGYALLFRPGGTAYRTGALPFRVDDLARRRPVDVDDRIVRFGVRPHFLHPDICRHGWPRAQAESAS